MSALVFHWETGPGSWKATSDLNTGQTSGWGTRETSFRKCWGDGRVPIPSRLLLATVVRSRKACARGGCARVCACPPGNGGNYFLRFRRKESGGGDNNAYPSPLFASSEDPAQKILRGPSVEDLAQRYQES